MEEALQLQILSPEATLVDTRAESVTLPGTAGRFQVLRDHAPLISSLEAGEIVYVTGGKAERLSIRSGFVEVADNAVSVCVEI